MNSSYSEEICSPLQLHPPPWKSRFSGPANLAQAVWMEVLWVSLPQKYLWNATPGSDFIGMTELGQGQKKKILPSSSLLLFLPWSRCVLYSKLIRPISRSIRIFSWGKHSNQEMLQPISKENLKLGRAAPDEEGRNELDVYLIATPRQLFSTVMAGRQNEQAPTRMFSPGHW